MADETAVKIDNLEANLEKTDNSPAPAPRGAPAGNAGVLKGLIGGKGVEESLRRVIR